MGGGEETGSLGACPRTPSLKIGMSTSADRREMVVAAGLITVLSIAALSTYLLWGPPLPLTAHDPIAIDGDANFADTALLEGWPGDGSPENPYIIDGLEIDLGGELGNCINIRNTLVSFIISNCSFTGAAGVGIYLENVTNGELVNNRCFSNGEYGISLCNSESNTVSDNICNNNSDGIRLEASSYEETVFNTLSNNSCFNNIEHGIDIGGWGWCPNVSHNTYLNNTCAGNGESGIFLEGYGFNTVANNTCNNNRIGIDIGGCNNTVADNTCNNNRIGIDIVAWFNTVANNTCNSNGESGIYLSSPAYTTVVNNTCNNNGGYGIYLEVSEYITVVNNTCNSNNASGIYLFESDSNTVANNTCLNNTEHDIYLHDSYSNVVANNIIGISEEFISVVLLLVGLVGITLLGGVWRWRDLGKGAHPSEIGEQEQKKEERIVE